MRCNTILRVRIRIQVAFNRFSLGDDFCRNVLGFSDAGFKLSRQPGWEPNSYGYHGDDGRKYRSLKEAQRVNPNVVITGENHATGYHMCPRPWPAAVQAPGLTPTAPAGPRGSSY